MDDANTADSASRARVESRLSEEDGWRLATQMAFDPEDANDLVVTIVSAVAETEGTTAAEITDPPLYDVIDIESLSDSFSRDTHSEHSLAVEFTYRGHRVVVRGDAWVQVYTSVSE